MISSTEACGALLADSPFLKLDPASMLVTMAPPVRYLPAAPAGQLVRLSADTRSTDAAPSPPLVLRL